MPMAGSTKYYLISPFLSIFFSLFSVGFTVLESRGGTGLDGTRGSTRPLVYNAGVVIDVNSKLGVMANICVSMALSDFYAEHPNYGTRLSLQTWDSLDGVAGTSSEHLQQQSAEASFAINLVESSTDPFNGPYLIRMDLGDFSRLAKATVAILKDFKWNQVLLIYEDMEYGNPVVPYLTHALEYKGIKLSAKTAIPTSAENFQILEELQLLITTPSKVIVVHMTTTLAARLFVVANKARMISKEFSWLVLSDDLCNFMDPVADLDSTKGALIGVRAYLPKTEALMKFKMRYKSTISEMKQNNASSELNLFSLWVYDTIWALAMAVERIGIANSSFLKQKKDKTSVDMLAARRTLEEILKSTSFKGISGDFDLVNGQLQPSTFEIFNLMEKKIIGYWSLDRGISGNSYSTFRNMVKKTIIHGDTRRILEADDDNRSPMGKKWKIGIPKKTGFTEFVKIEPGDKKGDHSELPGFSIEVFKAVWKALALPPSTDYEFEQFEGTYDDFCLQVKERKYDFAVGDISIVAGRTNSVDFTVPYLETGVAMLIKVSHDGSQDMWIFLKPLSWDLWLIIIFICIFIGIAVRVLDRRDNTELINGSPGKQIGTILMFPCLSVAAPQRDMVGTKWSRLVLIVWLFLAFILMQSYTANLSSILTVNQLQPTIPSFENLRNEYVGYSNGSFVKNFLIERYKFKGSRLKPYDTIDDYKDALSKGPNKGGVAAIFDEVPYFRLFLAKYTSGYMMVRPTYRKTDGLGFGFPIGSPLVANFSREILKFTQGPYMDALVKKYFGIISIDQDGIGQVSSSTPSLTSRSFAGLFIIIGVIVLLVLLVSENHALGRLLRRCIFRNSHDVLPAASSRVQPTSELTSVITNNLPTEINNIQGSHNSNQSNTDESTEEAALEVHSS